jgi:dipeptidyl aminopeptidase/acylaminoacyl peptidase
VWAPAPRLRGCCPTVRVAEAYKLERLLKRRGTEYEAEIYPGQGHVFTGAIARASVECTAEFFARTLHAIG